MAPVAWVVPLPISAMRYSKPCGRSIRAMLSPGDRVADRFARRCHQARDIQPRPPGFDIDLEVDRQKQRGQLVRRHGREHPPNGRHVLGLLARHDLDERVALARIRLVLDYQLDGAVALVDRPGEMNYERAIEAVEADVAEMSLVDFPGSRRLAKAMGRQRVELTRTAVGAIAVRKLIGADAPIDHDLPPCEPKMRAYRLAPVGAI